MQKMMETTVSTIPPAIEYNMIAMGLSSPSLVSLLLEGQEPVIFRLRPTPEVNSLLMQVFSLCPLEQPPTEAAAKSAHVAEVSSEQSALAWFSLVIVSPEHLVMVDMPFPSGLHFPTWSSGMSAHISPEQSALGDAHSLSDVDAPAAAGAVLGVLPASARRAAPGASTSLTPSVHSLPLPARGQGQGQG